MTAMMTKNEIDQAFRSWLEHFMKAKSLTQLQVAINFDVSPATIGHIINGRRNASDKLMDKILKKAGVNFNEALQPFLTGDKLKWTALPPAKRSESPPLPAMVAEKPAVLSFLVSGELEALRKENEDLKRKLDEARDRELELLQELEAARKRNDKLIDNLLAKDDRLKELIAKREELGAEMLVKDARIQEKERHIATLLRHIVDNGFEKGLPQDFLTLCAASIEQEDAAHKKNCTDHE